MADSTLPVNEEIARTLPEWYLGPAQDFSGFIQDYLTQMQDPNSGVMGGYTGDRIAAWDPYMQTAYNQAQSAGNIDNPYFDLGGNWMKQGRSLFNTGWDQLGEAGRTLDSGQSMINNQYSQIGNVDPYFRKWGTGALNQASQLIGGSAAYDPAVMQQHLSPYLSDVNDEIARLGNENLFEDILPGVNSTFTGAGQFGSTRNSDFTNRAIRDTQREILGAQSNAMNQAWGQAANDYLGWGKLGQEAGGQMTNVADAYGRLGSNLLDRYTTGANMGTSVANIGGQEGSLGNIQVDSSGRLVDMGGQYGTYGQTGANQQWSDINNLYGFGERGFNYDQSILDNAYNDWMQRWSYPLQLAGGLTSLIPQYSGKLEPDYAAYRAAPPAEDNVWDDIGALMEMLNGI